MGRMKWPFQKRQGATTQLQSPLNKDFARKLTAEELESILEAHEKWVATDGREGQRADLSETNLEGAELARRNLRKAIFAKAKLVNANLGEAILMDADLCSADLRRATLRNAIMNRATLLDAHLQAADLRNAVLDEVNLREADLRAANLTQAHLSGADMSGTALRDASFLDANLRNVKGLLVEQLAATNVSGADLPAHLAKFESLAVVDQASKNGRTLFLFMFLACAYSWLTMLATSDAALITNSKSSPLPIIAATVRIVSFYWGAPIALLALYIYFHLHLQRLWEVLASLPAILPDGRTVDKAAYPWLLNGLVCVHFTLLRSKRPPLSRLQTAIVILLAWWIVPLTLFFFWVRYIPRQDWAGTGLHVLLLSLSVGSAATTLYLSKTTLREGVVQPFSWRRALHDQRTYRCGMGMLGAALMFLWFSYGAIEGVRIPDTWAIRPYDIRTWLPYIVTRISPQFNPFAFLVREDLSVKPEGWMEGYKSREQIASVKGVNLFRQRLRFASASFAFLVNADLGYADLRWANLRGADLRGANLEGANLQFAWLHNANLQYANLKDAKLQQANLYQVDLQDANLEGADLERTYLLQADLRKAYFARNNLKGANLQGANLQGQTLQEWDLLKVDILGADLREADLSWGRFQLVRLQGVDLRRAILKRADLRGANLIHANLEGANLQGADLREANLHYAKLRGANLSEAKLEGAVLADVTGLTKSQIKAAIIDDTTQLPATFRKAHD